jgi:glycosyltransferase involved in cell wall biosynthesis
MQAPAPIKVVVLVHLMGPGGGETIALESAIGLDSQRYERTLCIGRWNQIEEVEPAVSMLRRAREAGVRVMHLKRGSRFALWAWWPLVRMLRRERVQILHTHMFGSNMWGCLLARLARVPVLVCHEHMWSYGGGRLRTWVDRWLIARSSDAFIAVSEAGLKSMIEVEHIRPSDVVLVRNGIPAVPPGEPGVVRAALGIDEAAPVITAIGTLRTEKAYEVLIEATAELVGELPDLRVLIAGAGPEREKLESLISELGLAGTVTLLGVRGDVPDILASSDLAVCCSDFEGGPLSVMEYMGAGLPVIGTRVGGLPELVRDGENGLLIPPRDPAALAAAARTLLADSGLRKKMGEAGRELREGEFGIDAYMERIEALYRRLLAAA